MNGKLARNKPGRASRGIFFGSACCSRTCGSGICPSRPKTSHINHVARFARFFRQPPERLGPEEIRTYQLHLINDRHLAPTSVAGAAAALRFPYQVTLKRDWAIDAIASPKRGDTFPVVLSSEEIVESTCLK